MIPKECKRLAEVDFPIAVVSKHSAREKSIRHGHPSTLHLWWARRPLAACRAMLLGLLLPDPCDKLCPEDFKEKSRKLLPEVQGQVGTKDEDLRRALLQFIGDFANWDLSTNRKYLEVSRGLVKAAHPEETPLVVDPFAGGGSIPLEALRLGCETFASDLNPVACLILKVMLEDIPRHGPELAEELQRVGAKVKQEAEKELAEFYPADSDGSRPIAYLWARTVRCEAPNCGAEIPLVRSFWLSKKEGRKRALRYKVAQVAQASSLHNKENIHEKSRQDACATVEFEIFEPKSDNEVPNGTVTRAKATCLCCNTVLSPDRVRAQLREQRGGADVVFGSANRSAGFQPAENTPSDLCRQDACATVIGGARLLAIVTLKPGEQGRHYRLPTDRDYEVVWKAQKRLKEILDEWERDGRKGLCPVPDEPLPQERQKGSSGFRILLYGMKNFGDLFIARQKLALFMLLSKASMHPSVISQFIAIGISKVAMQNSSCCRWKASGEALMDTFGRQALPIVWDFAESNIFAGSTGDFGVAINWIANVITGFLPLQGQGQIQQADACKSPLPDHSTYCWFTDPPYYDAIAYADLSDFFFVWLKRSIIGRSLLQGSIDLRSSLTPKNDEAIQDLHRLIDGKPKDRNFYEVKMSQAFAEGRRVLREDGIGSVVFAHKTTEGWESLLSSMIKGGWTITASWPIATEMSTRLVARDSAALATSIHLVCRPRAVVAQASSLHKKDLYEKSRQDACATGDWADVLRELPKRVGDWMERLQSEGIRGADLVFACIGPALEIYSKYSKVVDAQEREIPLGGDPESLEPHKRGFLAYVWEAVGRAALEQVLGTAEAKARNGASGSLEEDARLTALFLWTLQSTNGEKNTPSPQPSPTRGEGEISPEGDTENEVEDEEDEVPKGKTRGFSLVFDVARRFAQPLGIHLEEWEGRIIETNKGVVRLLSVSERAGQLFGEAGTRAFSETIENNPEGPVQLQLFPEKQERTLPEIKGRGKRHKKSGTHVSDDSLKTQHGSTTLDRVHAAMLLQSDGRANALRTLLKAEQERSPDFLRLANALSALYPKNSEEKRLIDAMLLAVPK